MFFPIFALQIRCAAILHCKSKVCKELAVGLWLSYGITLCK